MMVRFCIYNMEWMKDLFHQDGTPKKMNGPEKDDRKDAETGSNLADVVKPIDHDILCIAEGPDTLADGSETASQQLEAWADLQNLDNQYKSVHGIPSGGRQELCALFRSKKSNLFMIRKSGHPNILSTNHF